MLDHQMKVVKQLCSLFMLFTVLISCPGFAQEVSEDEALAIAFKEAVLSHDKEKIEDVFYKIKASSKAQIYLRKNMEDYYKVYDSYLLIERVKAIVPTGYVDQNFQTRTGGETRGRSRGGSTNRERALNHPNQDQRSLQERVRDYPIQEQMQRDRRTNGERAIESPNQSRRSNSDIMRNRR